MADVRIEVKRTAQSVWEVWIPTEKGGTCVITMTFDSYRQVWKFEVAVELMQQAPEAITASINLAILAIKNHDFRKDTYPDGD